MLTRLRLPQPTSKKPVLEYVVDGFIGRWMQSHNWGAFTLPLPVLTLILYWNTPNPAPGVRVHEYVHVYQTEHLFFFVAWYRYLRELAFKGYRANRYEVEAYEIEALGDANGFPSWADPNTDQDAMEFPVQPLLTGRTN